MTRSMSWLRTIFTQKLVKDLEPLAMIVKRNVTTKKQHSGLQKQVFGLYRKLLRTANLKDGEKLISSLYNEKSTVYAVKTKFRASSEKLNRRDVDRIEYSIRQGEKYVKTLQMKGVTSMRSS